MILQSHTDYEDSIDLPSVSDIEFRIKSRKYREFIKQSLKLGMFIPCDENDVSLDEPLLEHYTDCNEEQNSKDWLYNLEKYQQAKERVLFEGFEIKNSKIYNEEHIQFLGMIGNSSKYANINPFRWRDRFVNTKTIEDLVKYNLKLTDSAIKQLNL